MSDLQKEHDHLQKLYSSAEQAINSLQKEVVSLRSMVAILEAEKKQWEQSKVLQQQIIHQALTNVNTTNNSYLEENNRLKEEIKALRGN